MVEPIETEFSKFNYLTVFINRRLPLRYHNIYIGSSLWRNVEVSPGLRLASTSTLRLIHCKVIARNQVTLLEEKSKRFYR